MLSSPFTHLISVDFPEPDGPQTTTTSPFSTLAVQLDKTWNSGLYHLSTPDISMTGLEGLAVCADAAGVTTMKASPDDCRSCLQSPNRCRGRERDNEIDQSRK